MEYDPAHRNVLTTLMGPRYYTQEFDADSYVVARTDAMGTRITYQNSNNGRPLLCFNQPVGAPLPSAFGSYSYDANIPTSDGAIQWELDDAGRVAHVFGSNADVHYTYDHPLGLLTNKSYGDVSLDYHYDAAGYLETLGDGVTTLTYTQRTPDGRPVAANYSNGIKIAWGYESARYVNALSYTQNGTVLYGFNAQIDPQTGWRNSVTFAPTNEQFTYIPDAQMRLQSEIRTLNGVTTTTTHEYDAVGNRTFRTINGAKDKFDLNDRYELTNIEFADGSSFGFDYDFNGNCLHKNVYPVQIASVAAAPANGVQVASRQLPPLGATPTEITAYSWDFQNRLESAQRTVGGKVVAGAIFGLPSFGWQMLNSTVSTSDSQGNLLTFDHRDYGYGLGGELLHESVPGLPERTYVNAGVDHPLWSPGSGNPIFFLNDVNGSLYAIANSTGSATERQRFDAYGKTEQTNTTGTVLQPSQVGNRVGYQGRTNFAEIGLTNIRNRWYSSDTGGFISRDPWGLVNGPAVFGFCGGDPVNRSDPSGLDYIKIDMTQDPHVVYWVVTSGHGQEGDVLAEFPIGRYNKALLDRNDTFSFTNGYTIDADLFNNKFVVGVAEGDFESTRLPAGESYAAYAAAQFEGFKKFDKWFHPWLYRTAVAIGENAQRAVDIDEAKPFAAKIENDWWGIFKPFGRMYYRATDFIDQDAVSDADAAVAKLDLASHDLALGRRPITATEVENQIGRDIFTKGAPAALTVGSLGVALQPLEAVIPEGKWDYLFGRVASNNHNYYRSIQNLQQFSRIGVLESEGGRELLKQHLQTVLQSQSNIVETWTNEFGKFETRESMFIGPNGQAAKIESTWQIVEGGKRKLTTVIPTGGN